MSTTIARIDAVLLVLILLAGCAPEKPVRQDAAADDGCVGYRIKPDGSKECMRR